MSFKRSECLNLVSLEVILRSKKKPKIKYNCFIVCCLQYETHMNQGEPGVDYDDNNLNPLICDLCKKTFDGLDKLGEHQKAEHDM